MDAQKQFGRDVTHALDAYRGEYFEGTLGKVSVLIHNQLGRCEQRLTATQRLGGIRALDHAATPLISAKLRKVLGTGRPLFFFRRAFQGAKPLCAIGNGAAVDAIEIRDFVLNHS